MKKIAKNRKINNGKNKVEKQKLEDFIKTHILKKTKVLIIIGIILFVILTLISTLFDYNLVSESNVIEKTTILGALREKLIILILILLAGLVPYFYIPVFGYLGYIFILSGDVVFGIQKNGIILSLLLNILPSLVDILTVSIVSAIGIYMSNYSTKIYKYSQRTSISFIDVRMHFYELTKKQDKYDELAKKKQERIDKMKMNDVKIDYFNIFKILPFAIIINMLIGIIQYFIN